MTLTAEGMRTITCNVELFSFTGQFHLLGDLNKLKNTFRNLPPSKMLLKAQYWPLCFARLCCCFGFHGSEASIVIREFYSGRKQKP